MTLKYFNNVTDSLKLPLEKGTFYHFETQSQLQHSCPLFDSLTVFGIFADADESFDESRHISSMQLLNLTFLELFYISTSYFHQVFKESLSIVSHKQSCYPINKMS